MLPLVKHTLAKYSRFTWWTIPDPGGTINMLSNAEAPHFKNVNRSRFLSISLASFLALASTDLAKST